MQLPAVFEQDIQSKVINITTRVVIGEDEPIYLSTHSFTFEGQQYKPLLLDIPSMKESVDYEDRNFKTSNVTLKISNYKYSDGRFSDILKSNPLINQKCEIYWNSQRANSSADTLRIFKGYVRRVSHTDSQVSIQLEDLTEKHLHKTIPLNRTSKSLDRNDKYRDIPIPIAFGVLPQAPAVLDSGLVVKADSDSSIEIISENSAHYQPHPIWGNFSDFTDASPSYSPVIIKEENSTIYVMKEVAYPQFKYDTEESPQNHIQYYDHSDASMAPEQSGTVKINPFSGGGINKENIEILQVYGVGKPSSIECGLRSSQSFKNVDGLEFPQLEIDGNAQNNHGILGFENVPNRFRPFVSENLTDDDYTLNSLEYLNAGNINHNWDTAAGGSSHFDYSQAVDNGGVFESETENSAQGLIRISFLAEPSFTSVADPTTPHDFHTYIAINGVGIPWDERNCKMIFTRTLSATDAYALAYKADNLGTNLSDYYYLDGEKINLSDGSNDGFAGVDYRNIFQSLIDGQPDTNSYRGHASLMDGVISLLNVRRTISGVAGGTDFGAFIRIRNYIFGNYKKAFEIVIGSYVNAGYHEIEFEAGIGGDWSEIDLLRNTNIEFKSDADYYLAVTGRKDNNTLLRNPVDIIRHLAVVELGLDEDDDIDQTSYSNAKTIHSSLKFDFSVKDEINSKELFKEISKSTLCFPYFNNQGKLAFASYQKRYSLHDFANAKIIEDFDVISFSFDKTKLEQVYTQVNFKYNYNYSSEKYDSSLSVSSLDGIYSLSPSEDEMNYNGYQDIKDNVLELESPYIRDDETAEKIWKYKYRDHQFQHLTCKIKLPLKYIHLDVGDTIKFDKLLGGMKAFGIDYTRMVKLVGTSLLDETAIYPMFFITSVNKNLSSITIEARQLHHLDDSDIDQLGSAVLLGWGYEDEWEEPEEQPEEQPEEENVLPDNQFFMYFNQANMGTNEFPDVSQNDIQSFRTINGDNELYSNDIAYWSTPQAYGLDSFDAFIPNNIEEFTSGDIIDYEAIKISIPFSTYSAGTPMAQRAVLTLRNIGGVVVNPDNASYNFELGWSLELLDDDGNPVDYGYDDSGASFWENQNQDYSVIGLDTEYFYFLEQLIFIEFADGLKDAILHGQVDFDQLIFNAGLDIEINTQGYGIGDVNGDGTVNVGDIVSLVNHILEDGDLDSLGQMSADVNQDGAINVLDVVEMVWLILGGD